MEEKKNAENDGKLVVKLSKEYAFEGKKYIKIDLSGLDDLTAEDMISVNRILSRDGNTDILPEMSLEYACVLASKGSDLPIEFYKRLKPKDALKVKGCITHFLYGVE